MKRSLSPITLAFAVPIITLLLLAVSIFVPRYFVSPKYDFLFARYNMYDSGSIYLENGKIVETSPGKINYPGQETTPVTGGGTTKLYRYAVAQDTFQEISVEDANKLKLNGDRYSPDGFTFSGEYSSRVFMESSDRVMYLSGHGLVRKLTIPPAAGEAESVVFTAWIIP